MRPLLSTRAVRFPPQTLCLAAALLCGVPTASAQSPASRHAIGVFGGAWDSGDGGSGSRVTAEMAEVEVVGSAGIGGLRYRQRWREDWDWELSVTQLIEGEVSVAALGDVRTLAVGVTWMHLGMRRYLSRGGILPFVSLSVGVVRGSEDGVSVGTSVVTMARTETSPDGAVGVGCNLPLGRRLCLEFVAAYCVMSDFGEAVGGRDDYGGTTATLGLSWQWGAPSRE